MENVVKFPGCSRRRQHGRRREDSIKEVVNTLNRPARQTDQTAILCAIASLKEANDWVNQINNFDLGISEIRNGITAAISKLKEGT